jgi:hypothetical protein
VNPEDAQVMAEMNRKLAELETVNRELVERVAKDALKPATGVQARPPDLPISLRAVKLRYEYARQQAEARNDKDFIYPDVFREVEKPLLEYLIDLDEQKFVFVGMDLRRALAELAKLSKENQLIDRKFSDRIFECLCSVTDAVKLAQDEQEREAKKAATGK